MRATEADYLELSLGRFLDLVASGESVPGGGSVAAVAVALAASLSGMAARFSAQYLTDDAELLKRAEGLRERADLLVRADAAAYERVLAARAAGSVNDRVRAALSEAADVPLAVAEIGAEVARISARLVNDGNPNLKGDAICAVLLADAGVRAAAALVKINLSSAGIEDERLERTRELTETAAAARRSARDDPNPEAKRTTM